MSSIQTAYQYKNSSIPKVGPTGKTIYYSLPTSARSFEYQNPVMQPAYLSGKEIRHLPQKVSGERRSFSNFRVIPQPDSRRTLNPNLAPRQDLRRQRCKSSNQLRYNQESSNFSYISNVNNTSTRKPTDPRVYKSNFEFDDFAKAEPYHRLRGTNEYKRYNDKSQIANLPGATIRDTYDINDGYKPAVFVDQSESHLRRVNRDYNSNIACLPGSTINEAEKKNPYVCPNQIKYKNNNIFGEYENSKDNSFNVCHKKRAADNRNAFAPSNKHFDYNAPRTGIRRSGMKNISQIQLV